MMTDIIGYLSGILIVISMLPQVIQNLKTKKARDISLVRSSLYVFGVILFIVYGFLIKNNVIIIMNMIGFILGMISLISKVRYG